MSFFSRTALQPDVTYTVANASRENDKTTFIFTGEATLPFTKDDKHNKGHAWTVAASFFVYLRHGKQPTQEIADFIRRVAIPMLNIRFMSVVENLGALAGIVIHPLAGSGMTLFELESLDVSETIEVSDSTS